MPPENNTENKPENKTDIADAITDNPIAVSVLIGTVIVSICVLFGAHMVSNAISPGSAPTGTIAAGTQPAQTNPTPTPGTPVKIADRAGEPVLGNANAPVTIYEFADFQCPFCQNFFKNTLPDLKTKYIDTGKVKLIYRYFPLSFHVNAQVSAEAGECANRQGQFQAYHDVLYTNGQADGTNLDATSLKKYAAQVGLNMTTFNQCLDNHEAKATVAADQAAGTAAGVTGTPTFYINGVQIVGAQPTAIFEQSIDTMLKK